MPVAVDIRASIESALATFPDRSYADTVDALIAAGAIPQDGNPLHDRDTIIAHMARVYPEKRRTALVAQLEARTTANVARAKGVLAQAGHADVAPALGARADG